VPVQATALLVLVWGVTGCGEDRAARDAGSASDGALDATGGDRLDAASVPDAASPDAAVPVVDPACTQNGCLRSLEHVGDYAQSVLEPFLEPGVTIDYRVVAGGGHVDVAFGFVAQAQRRTEESIAWIRDRL